MKISYRWLKDYLNLTISPEELKEKMTFAGIEVEDIEYPGKSLEDIKVAKIEKIEKHPNADKLSVCTVNDGENDLQVICGAPNCKEAQKVAFAPIGSMVGDIKIKKAKLRGVKSYGMICSEKELGLSENHDGIMELSLDAEIGNNLASHLGMNDVVYDVEITPNRPDLLGMIGVARDIASFLDIDFKLPESDYSTSSLNINEFLKLENKNKDKCTRYTAQLIKDVHIEESPQWLQKKLLSIGLKPRNNIVDITNFVMMEYGHPLHAFDYEKIDGKKIIVRNAKNKEKFIALDEEEYKLTKNDLVIADKNKPIALAGVIGGKNSHITEKTTDIVIESANFIYSSVRKTSESFKIFTDSAYRFERDLSDENARLASNRAVKLIQEIAGGTVCYNILDSYPNPKEKNKVSLRLTKVKDFLTIDIKPQTVIKNLEKLGLKLIEKKLDELVFEVPYFRKDLTREIDLLEEIIRLHGYNNVRTYTYPPKIMDRNRFFLRRKIEDLLVKTGFFEVNNWPFADPEDIQKLKLDSKEYLDKIVKVKNPIGIRFSYMQSSLIPNLLKNCHLNFSYDQDDFKLFELAKVYFKSNDELADEHLYLSGLMTGNAKNTSWLEKSRKIDFFDVKGVVTEILNILKLENLTVKDSSEPYLQPGQCADVFLNDKKIGSMGKLDTIIAEKFDLEKEIFLFEIDLNSGLSVAGKNINRFRSLPKYPDVKRDISFIVSKAVPFEEITHIIESADKNIRSVELFDKYEGKGIEKGNLALSFNLVLNSMKSTLNDKKCNKIINKVFKKLKNEFNIKMR